MKKTLQTLVALGLVLGLAAVHPAAAQGKGKGKGKGPAAAQGKGPGNKYHAYSLVGESVGLQGYDPVSYYPEGGGKPQKGVYDLTFEHDGVTWRFATKENLEAFKKSPDKYLPAFGGWCAFGVGDENLRIEADPANYIMRDGKVLVFYHDAKVDTKPLFEKNADEIYKKAQTNWPALSK